MKKDEASKKNDVILIPSEKLQHGFDLCREQMELLIDSAEILHNSKKYPILLALSVLAREESAKLELINMHIGTPFGISKREWDSVTKGFVHENKLVNPVKFAQYYAKRVGKDMFEKVQEWGKNQGYEPASANYEDFMSVTEEHLKRLASLNVIKKKLFLFGLERL